MRGYTVPAYFSAASTLKDRGMSLRFTTQELANEEQIAIIDMCHNMGHLLFKANEIQESDIPDGDVYEGKTPSQRLRGVIFAYYQQLGGKEKRGDFEVFYRGQVESIINKYKKVLE